MLEGLLKRLCPDQTVLYNLISPLDPEYAKYLTDISTSTSIPSSSRTSLPTSHNNTPFTVTTSEKLPANSILDIIHRIADITIESHGSTEGRNGTEDVALTEKIKLISVESRNTSGFWGKKSGAMFMHTAKLFKNERPETDAQTKQRILQGRRRIYWIRPSWEKDLTCNPAGKYIFPPPDLIIKLTDAYFEHVNLFYPLLHRPTFKRAVANYLHLTDEGFGGVLLLVCALGSLYTEITDQTTLLDGVNPSLSVGWKWFSQVHVVKQRLFKPPSLYDLQSYCLAIEFLHGCYTPQALWILVGFGIRLSQDVGTFRRHVPREQLTVEDELWKRVFWVLIAMDLKISTAMGRPCAIHDDCFDADMPTECDDEYWEHPDPKQRFIQPEGVPSTVTAFNYQIRLNKIIAFALNSIYSTSSKFWYFMLQQWEQQIVNELDSSLNNWIASLPDYLRWDPNRMDTRFFRLSGSLMACYYYVQILIHRRYIRAKDKPLALVFPSLEICSSAARSCSLVLEAQMKRSVVMPYPYMQMTAMPSGIVLLLNVWSSKRSGVAADPNDKRLIEQCMYVLKKSEQRCRSAGMLLDVSYEIARFGELVLPEDSDLMLLQESNIRYNQLHTVQSISTESSIQPSAYESETYSRATSHQMAPQYSSPFGAMDNSMSLPSFMNISASSSQQQATVDSNTMDMWLNTPTNFHVNEWNAFLAEFNQ